MPRDLFSLIFFTLISWSFVISDHEWMRMKMSFVVVHNHSWSFVVFHKCIKNNQEWQLTKVYNSTNLLRMARIVLNSIKKQKFWIFLLIYERSQMTKNAQEWPRMTTNDHERPRTTTNDHEWISSLAHASYELPE